MNQKLSLSRWHKVVERLNVAAKTSNNLARSIYTETNVQSYTGEEQIAELQERQAKAEKAFAQVLLISKTVAEIRAVLAKENVTHGVHVLVAEQESLSRNIGFIKSILDQQSTDMVKIENIASCKALNEVNRYGQQVRVKVIKKENQEALEALLAKYQSRIHSLSDELSDINKATCTIEVPVEIAEIAGLK